MVSWNIALRLTLHLTATAFVIVFLLTSASAQRRLDGRVITSDSIPVHNAIVHLRLQEDTTKSFRTLTDSDGRFSFLLTGIETIGTAKEFALHPNYPNPFSSTTTISFSISHRESVTLRVHDLLSRQVRTLVSEQLEAGSYRVDWDGRDEANRRLPQGAYVSVLQTKNGIATGRLMLSGERQTDKPKTGLTQIGDVVRFGKSASLRQVLLDVQDTIAALPRFLTRSDISYSFESDTSVTIIVDYGGWEDLAFPSNGGHSLFLDEPYLYVCAGKYGLWRIDVEKLTPWEYLGLMDTVYARDGVKDVDAFKDDILVAYSGRNPQNIDSTVGVWRSNDAGRTWFRSDSGMPETFGQSPALMTISKIKRSPHRREIVTAQYYDAAMFRSTDSGYTWKVHYGSPTNVPWYADMRWNPYTEGELWVWGQRAVGIQTYLHVYEGFGDRRRKNIGSERGGPFAFDPVNPMRVFYTSGTLHETTDGGITWTIHDLPSVGRTQLYITEIIESPFDMKLYMFAASEWDPPHIAYILSRNLNQDGYSILTKLPTRGNGLVVDENRRYLYWNWAGNILRMSIKEY